MSRPKRDRSPTRASAAVTQRERDKKGNSNSNLVYAKGDAVNDAKEDVVLNVCSRQAPTNDVAPTVGKIQVVGANIDACCQLRPGRPFEGLETWEMRKDWFKQCLSLLADRKPKSVALQIYFCSNAYKPVWDEYIAILQRFSSLHNIKCVVYTNTD